MKHRKERVRSTWNQSDTTGSDCFGWTETVSIPVSATKSFKVKHLQFRRTWPMYKQYNELRKNGDVNSLSPPL